MKKYLEEFTQLWNDYYDQHVRLFKLTCDEYNTLLKDQIDDLEKKIFEKESNIKDIKNLEIKRTKLIEDFGNEFPENKPNGISNLISFFEKNFKDSTLRDINENLIYKIHQIQEQNKLNQVYINKVLSNLDTAKEGFGKPFTTYNSKGFSVMNNGR